MKPDRLLCVHTVKRADGTTCVGKYCYHITHKVVAGEERLYTSDVHYVPVHELNKVHHHTADLLKPGQSESTVWQYYDEPDAGSIVFENPEYSLAQPAKNVHIGMP